MTRPTDGITTFSRLRATPLRDLIRGELTGRLSPEILAHDAGLPDALRRAVRETAVRTRLFRGERAEVAQELVAHFRDGLAAGRAPAELVDSFGRTRDAARLIRRAKKRERSLALRSALYAAKGAGAFVALLLVIYLVLAARHSGARVGPLVDYRSRLTAKASSVPPDDRAWPVYRAVLMETTLRERMTEVNLGACRGWRDWPEAVAMLDAHRDALDAVRRGARMSGLGFVIGDVEDDELWPGTTNSRMRGPLSGSLLNILLPHLGEMRRLALLLAADTRLAAERGDGPRMCGNVEALLGLADQVRETPILLNDLVAVSIAASACDELLRVLEDSGDVLADGDLRDLAHALAAYPNDGEPLVRLSGDLLLYEDMVQRLYSLDDSGDGVLIAGALDAMADVAGEPAPPTVGARLAGPIAAVVHAGRKETLGVIRGQADAAEAWARRPLWERPAMPDPFAGASLVTRLRLSVALLAPPTYEHALVQGDQLEQIRQATLTAVALELFRRREGRWPENLVELTPDLLPRVPVDVFDGLPLKYMLRNGRPVLYSVGNNYRDDGGVAPMEGSASAWIPRERAARMESGIISEPPASRPWERTPPAEGDWIIVPPPERKEPVPEDRFQPSGATGGASRSASAD